MKSKPTLTAVRRAGRQRDLVGHRVGLALHRVAGLRHGERAARGRAALLDDVGELVRDQLVAVDAEPGLYSPCAK